MLCQKQSIRPHLANKGGLVGLLLATLTFKALLQLGNLGLQSCSAALMLSDAAIPIRNDRSEVVNGLVQGHDPEGLHISQLSLQFLLLCLHNPVLSYQLSDIREIFCAVNGEQVF